MVKQQGYIALIAVLIVGAAATAVALTLLMTGTDSQRAALVQRQAKQAKSLAVACGEEALLQIQGSTSYTGTSNLSQGAGSCTYTVTNTGGQNRTIVTTGTVDDVVSRINIYATIGTSISITSWQEVST